jgi:DNA-directed RNA polymerase specialized sigma24 family protein
VSPEDLYTLLTQRYHFSEDIAQDTVVKYLEVGPETIQYPGTWGYRVAKNIGRMEARKVQGRATIAREFVPLPKEEYKRLQKTSPTMLTHPAQQLALCEARETLGRLPKRLVEQAMGIRLGKNERQRVRSAVKRLKKRGLI